ncbi:MAG TPA: c-type cytochrome biogenesis protein CcmI [Gammaproteobacteria bacterium]|nr:c-type cytochrome biogenesis protein CcmI [Gammaproteobacteria bacterium]
MSTFHIGAALVGLVVVLCLLWPLLAAHGIGPSERRAVLAVYRQRLRELGEQQAAGQLDDAAHDLAREELETELATELGRLDAREAPGRAAPAWLSALLLLLVVPAATLWLYQHTGGYVAAEGATRLAAERAAQRESVERLAARLRQRLDDVEGWWLLGRSWLQLGEPDRAVAALAQAYIIAGTDPGLSAERIADLAFDYARALAGIQEDRLTGAPARIIDHNLERFPTNSRLLWLSVLLALEQDRREEALGRLDRLRASLPADSEDRARLDNMRARIAADLDAATARAGAAADMATDAEAGDATTGTTAPNAGSETAEPAQVRVAVRLDPALAARTAPDDTVFVFARAVDGPAMPLAVARARVADLPLEVTLDDSLAMAPQFRLSSASQVAIGARISRTGQAMAASGDIDGQAEAPVDPRAPGATVSVLLGRVVP